MSKKELKIALVTDPITEPINGFVKDIYETFADIKIHTGYSNRDVDLKELNIQESFVGRLPKFLIGDFTLGLAYDSMKLDEYDAVINLSSYTLKKYNGKLIYIYPQIIDGIKSEDIIITPSEYVSRQLLRKHKRDSHVIYSPIDVSGIVEKTDVNRKENWFLYMAQNYSDEGLKLVIQAAYEAKTPVKITSSDSNDIDSMRGLVKKLNAKGYVKFLGELDDDILYDLISKAKAVIHTDKSDNTGVIPMKTNASGTPVLAYKRGASTETISEDNPKTGVFFDKYNYKSLAKVLKNFDGRKYNSANCRKQSQNFAIEIFRYKLRTYVEDVLQSK